MPPTNQELLQNGELVSKPGDNSNPKSRLRFCSDVVSREGADKEDNLVAIADHYRAILRLLGEDPEREGLLDTPMRAAKAMQFFTKGYDDTISSAVKKVILN
jgi:hypothetical protein